MRDVQRNKQTIYYALRTGHTENLDEYGNVTGTYTEEYSEPIKLRINVGVPKGTIDLEQFGLSSQYSMLLTTTDMRCPIAEDSVLWIGIEPSLPYNYVVIKIAPMINQLVIQVREVHVS